MVAQNPGDSFSRYGLAMEYVNLGNLEQAVEEFRGLIGVNPNYSYAYFHGGRALEKLGREDEARELYAQGIEVARKIGDDHALSELQAAHDLV